MNDEVSRLVPKSWEDRGNPLTIEVAHWREAVTLVGKRYRPNIGFGLDKSTVPTFLKVLRQALEQQPESRSRLDGLLKFLTGPGRLGFTLSRGYRSAR
ncbi:MAG: hypothetical protein C0467_16075 [Planctomycetaceae bacterium]|nr:hypothetical protein [Planctomycetaceae bacterium]